MFSLNGWIETLTPQNWKQNVIKYIVQGTIGSFLEKELDWDQLDLHFVNGTLTLLDLELSHSLDTYLLPLGYKLRQGQVGRLCITVPWTGFLKEAVSMEIDDLVLYLDKCEPVKPKEMPDPLSESIHFADSLKNSTQELEPEIEQETSQMGIKTVSQIINSILSKTMLTLNRTKIRIIFETDSFLEARMERMQIIDSTQENLVPERLYIQNPDRLTKYMIIENVELHMMENKRLAQLLRLSQSCSRITMRSENPKTEDEEQMLVRTIVEKVVCLGDSYEFGYLIKMLTHESEIQEQPVKKDTNKLESVLELEQFLFCLFQGKKSEHLPRQFQDFCSSVDNVPPTLVSRDHLSVGVTDLKIVFKKNPDNREPKQTKLEIQNLQLKEWHSDQQLYTQHLQKLNHEPIFQTFFSLKQHKYTGSIVPKAEEGPLFGSITCKVPEVQLVLDQNVLNWTRYLEGFEKQKSKKSPVKSPFDLNVQKLRLLFKDIALDLSDLNVNLLGPTDPLNDPEMTLKCNVQLGTMDNGFSPLVSLDQLHIHYAGIVPNEIGGLDDDLIKKQHELMRHLETSDKDWSDVGEDQSQSSSPKVEEHLVFGPELLSSRYFFTVQAQILRVIVPESKLQRLESVIQYAQQLQTTPQVSKQEPLLVLMNLNQLNCSFYTKEQQLDLKIDDLDLVLATSTKNQSNLLHLDLSADNMTLENDRTLLNGLQPQVLKLVYSQSDQFPSLTRDAQLSVGLHNLALHLPFELKNPIKLLPSTSPFTTTMDAVLISDANLITFVKDNVHLAGFVDGQLSNDKNFKFSQIRVYLQDGDLGHDHLCTTHQEKLSLEEFGYAHVLKLENLVISANQGQNDRVEVMFDQCIIDLSRDTLPLLSLLETKLPKVEKEKQVSNQETNVMEQVEEQAYVKPERKMEDWQLDFDESTIKEKLTVFEHAKTFVWDKEYLQTQKKEEKPAKSRLSIKNSNICVKLFDGYDFASPPRQHQHSVQLRVFGLNVDYAVFESTNDLDIRIRDLDILDNVPTSEWRNFLCYWTPEKDQLPRQTNQDFLNFHLASILESDKTELMMNIKVLPIRMYVDQDTLVFLTQFFKEDQKSESNAFFRKVYVDSIKIKIDYKAKKVDMDKIKRGKLQEIINLVPLDNLVLDLVPIGLSGVQSRDLGKQLMNSWLPHIKDTQIPNIIRGIYGVGALVDVGKGVRDFVQIPMQERPMKQVTIKSKKLLFSTALSTVKLTNKLARGATNLLEKAEELMTDEKKIKSNQVPHDFGEGLQMGYQSLSDGLSKAKQVMNNQEKRLSDIPVAMLQPVIGFTDAVSKALFGLSNSLDKNQSQQKYK
ncbi:hypothetical protein EDD86DRAFT_205642 [Gorgonomyces haynaldii]|nr:hypothetical protein EDD86DRAFT_205642 [Gorgonomyces haynaldii]